MNKLYLTFLVIGSFFLSHLSAQTFQRGDFAIHSSVENFTGKYNIGGEYFFRKLNIKGDTSTNLLSLFLNLGVTNTQLSNLSLSGNSMNVELRWYFQALLKPSWNEYLSLKLDIGNYAWNNTKVTANFIGLSMGIHPKITGRLFAFLQTDIGFYKNMPEMFAPIYHDPNTNFISKFGIGANGGLSFLIVRKR